MGFGGFSEGLGVLCVLRGLGDFLGFCVFCWFSWFWRICEIFRGVGSFLMLLMIFEIFV